MLESPGARLRPASPFRGPSQGTRPSSSVQVMSMKPSPSASPLNSSSTRKLAMAVHPYEVQRNVSRGSSQRSISRGAADHRRGFTRDQSRSTSAGRVNQPQFQSQIRPTMTSDSSTHATGSSAWHDDRLQKGYNHSNTFQKRLEEQAAAAIQKAEQKTVMEYDKKIANSLKTLEAIEKRKKNDLRLIELRKKTEMEKVKDKLAKEMYDEEKRALRHEQESLKKEVLAIKGKNSELRFNCRKMAAQNKQIMAEIESNGKVAQEVEHHHAIVAQLKNINKVFTTAHEEAIQDLKNLEADCKKETKEKRKIQNWIDSLVTLMEQRCKEPKVMKRVHKIERQAKAQRVLVIDKRRKKHRSSKRSQRSLRSGTTTVLRKKVQNMRKQASETHILEDRAKLSAALSARQDREERQEQEQERAPEETSRNGNGDHGDAMKKAKRANKKMDKRRKEIENIVSEMRKLDVKDNDPPLEIFI